MTARLPLELFSKTLISILGCFVFTINLAKADGTGTSGGGSIVKDPSGKHLLADSLFKIEQKIPRKYDEKDSVNIPKMFPEAWVEYSNIVKIISERSSTSSELFKNKNIRSMNFEYANKWGEEMGRDFDVYWTLQMSGKDLMVVSGSQVIQASFTYQTKTVINSRQVLQKIIELDRSIFEKLSPRLQALLLFHEVLHHIPDCDHHFIASIVKSMDVALTIFEKQKKGIYKISENEYSALVDLQKNLCALNFNLMNEENESCTEDFANYVVNRQGGGLVSQDNTDSNYIDIHSVVQLDETNKNNFVNNKVINSRIHFGMGKKCENNQFEGVLKTSIVCNNSSNSLMVNICKKERYSSPPTFTECYFYLEGDRIKLTNVKGDSIHLILGGNNLVSNFDFNGVLKLLPFTHLMDSKIRMFKKTHHNEDYILHLQTRSETTLKNLNLELGINPDFERSYDFQEDNTKPHVVIQVEASALDFGGKQRFVNLDTLKNTLFGFSQKNILKMKSVNQFDKDYVD